MGFKVESSVLGDRQGREGSRGGLSDIQWPSVSPWSRDGWRSKGQEYPVGAEEVGTWGTQAPIPARVEFESISPWKDHMVDKQVDESGSQTTWLLGLHSLTY